MIVNLQLCDKYCDKSLYGYVFLPIGAMILILSFGNWAQRC